MVFRLFSRFSCVRRIPASNRGRRRKQFLSATLSLGLILIFLSTLLGVSRPAVASTVTLTYSYSSFTNGATWTVPAGVTSINFDMRGGAGGRGGTDGKGAGSGGPYGRLRGTIAVTQGNQIGVFPGGSGGNGNGCFANASGGAGGLSSYKVVTYNGGRGGNAGNVGCSGGGGGGGAASILTVDAVVKGLATGAGGGGGGNNVATPTSGRGAYPHENQLSGSTTISGGKNGGAGLRGDSCSGSNDGGGSGGGGGGDWSGQAGDVINGSECRGQGGWRGDNRWEGSGLDNLPAGFTSSYTISETSSVIYISYTLSVSTPDLTAATDFGTSNSDNITNTNAPVFTGTATGGSTIQLLVDGSVNAACGTANTTTGAYSCTGSSLNSGSRSITVRSTMNGVSVTSSALAITIDRTAPTITVSRSGSGTLKAGDTMTVSFSLSEQSTNFVQSDVSVSGGSLSVFSGSDRSYTAVFTPTDGENGSASISVSSGVFTDTAGNGNTASSTLSIAYDTKRPTVEWTTPASPSSYRTLTFTATFSESISGFTSGDLSNAATTNPASGCVFSPAASSGTSISVTVTCSTDGNVVLRIASGGVVDSASNTGPSLATDSGNVVVNASRTVSYRVNHSPAGDSSEEFASIVTTVEGTLAASPGAPTRTGYTFAGWAATSSGEPVTFPYAHGKSTDFFMYAVWTPNVLTVIWDTDGGTIVDDTTTVSGGVVQSPSGANPTRSGFEFLYWSTQPAGEKISFPYTHNRTSSFALYAVWESQPFDVTWDLNYDPGEGESRTYGTESTTSGGSLSSSPGTPTRSGYDFSGWSATSDGWPVNFPYRHNKTSNFTMFALWRSVDEVGNFWFYPGPGEPGMSDLMTPETMTPAFPRSVDVYEVSTTITTATGVEALDTVTMCWYKIGDNLSTDQCSEASEKPQREFKVTWRQSSNSFVKTGPSNNYVLAAASDTGGASTSGYTEGSISMNIKFRFKISSAMRPGSWGVKVTVLDDSGQSLAKTDTSTVNAFYQVMSGRPLQNYGGVAPGGTVTIENFLAGSYATNTAADMTLHGDDFNCAGCSESDKVTLKTDEGVPALGEVAVECNTGAQIGNPRRVQKIPSKLGLALIETLEELDNRKRMSCRLIYGGGAPRALETYSTTMTVGIGPP